MALALYSLTRTSCPLCVKLPRQAIGSLCTLAMSGAKSKGDSIKLGKELTEDVNKARRGRCRIATNFVAAKAETRALKELMDGAAGDPPP